MRRLYLQVYLAFLGIVVIFVALGSAAWVFWPLGPDDRRTLDGIAQVLAQSLPAPERPAAETQAALEQLAERMPVHVAVYAAGGAPVAQVGRELPPLPPDITESGPLRTRGRGPTFALKLPDGRWAVVRWHHTGRATALAASLALLALAIALGAWPLARRITGRLERLKAQAEALGEGRLSARVQVEGNDEVAELARSLNRAAERIERLMDAQRSTLAFASHELRSPLARMRVAAELLGEHRPDLRQRLAQDIDELDGLVEEILLASRLEAVEGLEHTEPVDLLALLAEEGSRTGAEVDGRSVTVTGDARLLRRMVRNLLENARRHGGGTPVQASAEPVDGGGALLTVCDRGPGVPAAARERVFEPFYRPPGSAESGSGFGLGLALVRQIARHHGASASCGDRPGGGSCFSVRFSGGGGAAAPASKD